MPITEAVITIGRGLDNDIVLDDRRVSRQHAQLRRRFGQYVLYDLDSSGGTTVNGRPVREAPLQAGDVIALAGVRMRLESVDTADTTDETRPPSTTQPISRSKRGAGT